MTGTHRTGVEGVEHFTPLPQELTGVPLQDCWCVQPCCWDGRRCTCSGCYCMNPDFVPPWKEEKKA